MANRNKSGGGGGSSASGGGRRTGGKPTSGTSGARAGGTTSGPGHTDGRGDADIRQADQGDRGTRQSEMGDIGVTGDTRGDIRDTGQQQQHRSGRTGTGRGAGMSGQTDERGDEGSLPVRVTRLAAARDAQQR